MGIRRLAAAIALLTLALAGTAQASQRYASPTGTGTACEQTAPCEILQAYREAKPGDEVIVTGGTYNLKTEELYTPNHGVTIHGNPTEPPPLIIGDPTGAVLFNEGGTVEYLDIENKGPYDGIYCDGCTVDRVTAITTVPKSWAVEGYEGSTVRDSLMLANGHEAIGFWGVGYRPNVSDSLINDTVIATGTGSIGAKSLYGYSSPGGNLVELRNTIASGEGTDLLSEETSPGYVGEFSAKNSNYDSVELKSPGALLDEGGNQSAAPIFVNPATDDFHEAAGSPTIDAGVAGGLGALDLGGGARAQGAAVDIGAYEYTPPPPPAGTIQSLMLKPRAFRVGKGTSVSYSLSAAGAADFTVERKVPGRKAGKKCAKKTKANSGKPKCTLLKSVKGSIAETGGAGSNGFKFSGKLGGKALRPGAYLLIGSAGGAEKQAGFTILK